MQTALHEHAPVAYYICFAKHKLQSSHNKPHHDYIIYI